VAAVAPHGFGTWASALQLSQRTLGGPNVVESRRMRVFMDARDLIDIFNDSDPISPDELAALFREKNAELVLPFSVISELVPSDNNTLVVARRFVKIEEDVPHVFLQQSELPLTELRIAASDFLIGKPPRAHDPFVPQFQDLWGQRFDRIFLMDLDRTVGLRRMSAQIDIAVQQRSEIFHWQENEGAAIVQVLKEEQGATTTGKPKDVFRNMVGRWLARANSRLSDEQLQNFADLLRRNSRIAPGWRLHVEVLDQLGRDKSYQPTVNDALDLANIMFVPYVDALTLDKNKVDLVKRATRRLHVFDRTIDYPVRVVARVEELLDRLRE
jgi:hypothetical protein